MGMHICQREVAECETQIVTEFVLYLLHHRECLAAVWALVIPILDQRNRRIDRALEVVASSDRKRERSGGNLTDRAFHGSSLLDCSISSRAAMMPSAPGL